MNETKAELSPQAEPAEFSSLVDVLRRRAAEQPNDPAYIFLPDRGAKPAFIVFCRTLCARPRGGREPGRARTERRQSGPAVFAGFGFHRRVLRLPPGRCNRGADDGPAARQLEGCQCGHSGGLLAALCDDPPRVADRCSAGADGAFRHWGARLGPCRFLPCGFRRTAGPASPSRAGRHRASTVHLRVDLLTQRGHRQPWQPDRKLRDDPHCARQYAKLDACQLGPALPRHGAHFECAAVALYRSAVRSVGAGQLHAAPAQLVAGDPRLSRRRSRAAPISRSISASNATVPKSSTASISLAGRSP